VGLCVISRHYGFDKNIEITAVIPEVENFGGRYAKQIVWRNSIYDCIILNNTIRMISRIRIIFQEIY